MTIDHLETRIVILHGPSQQYLQCHTGNAPQPFESSPGRKVYFLASTGYAKAAGELLQHRTMPCSLALGVKEGTSKLLVSEDLSHCSSARRVHRNYHSSLPVYILGHMQRPCCHCTFREMCLFPQHKKSYKQRYGKAMCKGKQEEEISGA